MATYTSNYGWTKPSGSDNVDISVLNNNLDNQDSVIHNAFLNMAVPFSELSTYAVDDIVLYDTGLYKCHTAVVTPGSWTGSTNWQVYKLSEGGGGGLTLGETSSTAYRGDRGKTAYDHSQTTGNPHGTTASDVGLGNVPNVSTNDQTPTFSEASTRNNIASGEKLSVVLGKIAKFFNDLKSVAYSGSYTDLSNKPENANTFQGTIAEWNQLSTAEKKAYDHASIPDSIDGGVTFPANKVVMTGGGNVEDALGDMQLFETLTKADLIDESAQSADITLNTFSIIKIKGLPLGRLIIELRTSADVGVQGVNLGILKTNIFESPRPIANCVNYTDGVPEGTIFVYLGRQIKIFSLSANKTYIVDMLVTLKS